MILLFSVIDSLLLKGIKLISTVQTNKSHGTDIIRDHMMMCYYSHTHTVPAKIVPLINDVGGKWIVVGIR